MYDDVDEPLDNSDQDQDDGGDAASPEPEPDAASMPRESTASEEPAPAPESDSRPSSRTEEVDRGRESPRGPPSSASGGGQVNLFGIITDQGPKPKWQRGWAFNALQSVAGSTRTLRSFCRFVQVFARFVRFACDHRPRNA